MRKFLSVLLALITISLTFSGCSNEEEKKLYVNPRANSARNFEYAVFKKGEKEFIRITAYIGSKNEVIIPEAIDNLPVREISRSAFSPSNRKMSVKYVNLTIPDTVITYEDDRVFLSFESDSVISSIHFGKGITKLVSKAFYEMKMLRSVSGGENIKSIGDGCFFGCTNLESIEFGDNVTEIGSAAFRYCDSLVDVKLGDNIRELDVSCFSNCKNLKNISLNKNLEVIKTQAFTNCPSLEKIEFPAGRIMVHKDQFEKSENLKTVVIGGDISGWEEGALRYTQIKNLIIKDGVKKLDCVRIFGVNNYIEEITIPKSVEKISDSFLEGCFDLKEVVFEGNAPKELGGKVFGEPNKNIKIYYKKGATGFKESHLAKDYTLVEY